ncbi:MAG TPA: hypothetical protein VN611_03355 [Patescibacteria group bacterium]|nr:hypothetical protein [Patescibacteria group bacterium]
MDIFLTIVQLFWSLGVKETWMIVILFLVPWIFIIWQAYFWINYFETYSANKLKNEYQESLKMLADNPRNKLLRQQALIAGRMYYGSLRSDGVPNMYDEITVDKHIRAAAGAPSAEEFQMQQNSAGSSPSFQSDMTDAELVQGALSYIRKTEL